MLSDPEFLTRRHLPALDAVRGVAILMVMLFHFTMMAGNDTSLAVVMGKAVVLGRCGVDLFFVLSGFLITGLLLDAKGSSGFFRTFYARRILRIFPLYLGALALFLWVLPLVFGVRVGDYDRLVRNQLWLWLHMANLALLVKGNGALGDLGHLWSLAVEEHFYLVWPAVVFFVSRTTLLRICGGVAVASLALRVYLMMQGDYHFTCYVFTPCRIDQLAVGAWVAAFARGPRGLLPLVRPARWLAPIGFVLLVALLATRDRFGAGDHDKLMPTIGYSILAVAFASCLVLAVTLATRSPHNWFVRSPVLRTFGKYSYAIYIFHFLIFGRLLMLYPHGGDGSNARFVVYYILMGTAGLLLSLLAAWVSWNIWEKWFLKLKRHFVYRHAARPSTPRLETIVGNPAVA